MEKSDQKERLVIVSNRLPIVLEKKDGHLTVKPGSGGLITALAPVMQKRGGVWIGWPGIYGLDEKEMQQIVREFHQHSGFDLYPVDLTEQEVTLYYQGFSNKVIWPLFHDLHFKCHFEPQYWTSYQQVNERFAEKVLSVLRPDDFVWVHDYHFLQLALELRKKGVKTKLSFFLHIPFAPPDIFMKIPWRIELLRGMLEYDYLGFQTPRDQQNFIASVNALLPEAHFYQDNRGIYCLCNGREVHCGAFPISIDFNEFEEQAKKADTGTVRKTYNNRQIVFSIDRLDYTKGITYRLEAIRFFLKQYPDLHDKVTFVQVVVPSRSEISEYSDLKSEIDSLVGDINSTFTKPGWVPIHYSFRSMDRQELVSFYRAADVMLITSVKDGMNLVAKEFVASNIDETGTLLLSEFAGAASELRKGAFLINPYDVPGTAAALYQALTLSAEDRRARMHHLRRIVKHNDIYSWIDKVINCG